MAQYVRALILAVLFIGITNDNGAVYSIQGSVSDTGAYAGILYRHQGHYIAHE